MSAATAVRVLPADVFDALELSALAYGGIGADLLRDAVGPCCLYGHALFLDDLTGQSVAHYRTAVTTEIAMAITPLTVEENDRAVYRVNMRHGRRGILAWTRVPFAAWCAELGVVRGDR